MPCPLPARHALPLPPQPSGGPPCGYWARFALGRPQPRGQDYTPILMRRRRDDKSCNLVRDGADEEAYKNSFIYLTVMGLAQTVLDRRLLLGNGRAAGCVLWRADGAERRARRLFSRGQRPRTEEDDGARWSELGVYVRIRTQMDSFANAELAWNDGRGHVEWLGHGRQDLSLSVPAMSSLASLTRKLEAHTVSMRTGQGRGRGRRGWGLEDPLGGGGGGGARRTCTTGPWAQWS